MKNRSAFTLVELVVVIMILGILAGVAAPKLLNTSSQATDNGLKQTLSVIRNAIELYAAENAGTLPPCSAAPGADFKTALADYIRGEFPASPLGSGAAITPTTGAPTANGATDWMYSTDTGDFIANSTASDRDSVTYASY